MERNDKLRKRVREGMEDTNKLFDQLVSFVPSPRSVENVKTRVKKLFVSAKLFLVILEGELQGEGDAAEVRILLDLVLLTTMARTKLFKTNLPGAQEPGVYLEQARTRARNLGAMFLTNCATTEGEMERMLMVFGAG